MAKRKSVREKTMETMLRKAFYLGFEASREGYNGDYGCSIGDEKLEKECNDAIREILANLTARHEG